MLAGLTHLAQATPPFSTPVFATFWFAVVVAVVLLAVYLWVRLRDRTYLFYGGYVGAIGVMSLIDHVLGDRLHESMGDAFIYVNNVLHLPYALLYLGFVGCYFHVCEQAPGWARFHRLLLTAYAVVFAWLVVDVVRGTSGSEWGILGCNFVNLISSFVLAGIATHDNRPGAREFLYASLPLAVSGLVLVAQFLSDAAHAGGPALLAFRTGFIMHVMVFLIALSVRYRELRIRLG
ncbi:MAG: 7TM diverse intracellular signaling domain-containing protein [Opitutaceae bacterium]